MANFEGRIPSKPVLGQKVPNEIGQSGLRMVTTEQHGKPQLDTPTQVGDAAVRLFDVIARKSGLDEYSSLWIRDTRKETSKEQLYAFSTLLAIVGLMERQGDDGDKKDQSQRRQKLEQQMRTAIPLNVRNSVLQQLRRLPKKVLAALCDVLKLVDECEVDEIPLFYGPSSKSQKPETEPNDSKTSGKTPSDDDKYLSILTLIDHIERALNETGDAMLPNSQRVQR